MKRVVIAGGGFGGIAASRKLRSELDEGDEVVLIDKATHFAMGFRKTDAIVGRAPLADTVRPLSALERFGIRVVNAEITAIDPGAMRVDAGGDSYDADAILVALGAETVPGAVPGLAEHGRNVYSHEGATRAAEAVKSLEKGNRLAVGIFGAPYKCPPAPFEMALLLHERLHAKRVEIEVFSPLPMSLPVLGAAGCETIESRLLGLMIGFRRGAKAASVGADHVEFEDGEKLAFDVLLAIPPHRVPGVVTDAGLAPQGGWVKVDPMSMRTSFDGVWACGDVVAIPMANGQPMPKAGAFAEGGGLVAAAHIVASLRGGSSDERFWADGACFLEVGDGEAMLVRGRFLADGAPQVELTDPTAAFLAEKSEFERARLAEWFGS